MTELEIDQVARTFPARQGHAPTRALEPIDLDVGNNDFVTILGPSGCGKSTLLRIIAGLDRPTSGRVILDGQEVAGPGADRGMVFQSYTLFPWLTVRENIAFGVEHATDEDVQWAAEAANIANEIEEFPGKYKTLVGERGITLSGGQKQRTAIARALIRNPRILILDDALSSVDTQTEDKILNHLRDVMQGRTTIFISHRVSTVRNADRIAVLHGGRIVELGTHEELLVRNGYYTDLYNKQLLEEELAEV
jgi:ATP-binding cassette subfamily B protein